MIDIGVASPSAQGQAMISTVTAATSAKVKRGSGPNIIQAANANSAAAITAGTNQPATRSASRWIGARERCAFATMIDDPRQHGVAADFSARMHQPAALVDGAADHASPSAFATGIDSPVTMDSSTKELPSVTTPSTGIFSPGRTRKRSPTAIVSIATSSSPCGGDAPRGLRRQTEQRADRARGARPRPQFQHLPQQHQHRDDGRRLEIHRDRAMHVAEGGRKQLRRQRADDAVEHRPRRCPSRSA